MSARASVCVIVVLSHAGYWYCPLLFSSEQRAALRSQ